MKKYLLLFGAACCVSLVAVSAQDGQKGNPLDASLPSGIANTPENTTQIKFVRRCGTVAPEAKHREAMRLRLSPFRAQNLDAMRKAGPVTVPVYFHVLSKGAEGNVADDRIHKQIDVLNADYKASGFQFHLKAISRTDVTDPAINKPAWFAMTPGSAEELGAKTKLGVDSSRNLNLYSGAPTDPTIGTLLGYATFPWDQSGDPERDGVVVLHTSLPGGEAPFNLGKTATHEVGHWLGLYHTFQGGCVPPGDEVDDTQPQPDGDNIFQCDAASNVCSGGVPAKAPIHNYMNYADDTCLNQFTPHQRDRMQIKVGTFRPLLVHAAVRKDLRVLYSTQ